MPTPLHRLFSFRSWPLRRQARVSVCLLIVVLSAAVAEMWVLHASARLRQDAGLQMLQTARDMADRLSREMANRVNDVQLLSRIDLFRDTRDPAAMRAALENLREGLPAYAWIGVTNADGVVVAATDDILVGKSIAQRPVFLNGRQGLWTGDVHEAVMLASFVPHGAGESVKFVDAAAPVRGSDGTPRGVLALHMSWQWAAQVRDALLRPRGANPSLQLMVFGADGRLLLAPPASAPTLPTQAIAALEENWGIGHWSDGQESISASAESRPSGEFLGFGWRVVARDPMAVSAADIAALRRDAWSWCLGIGAACALAAWWLIGWMVAPVDRLARTLAHHTETAPAPLSVPPYSHAARPSAGQGQRRNDVQRISAAVAKLQHTLKDRDRAVQTLEQRAHLDPLTGLHNRAYLALLTQRLEQPEPTEQTRPDMDFCVLCLDLDDFKPINDRHGHAAGDQVLAQIGARLRHCAREQDFVFRLGGDEFMLLLPCPRGEGTQLARGIASRALSDLQRPVSYLTLSGLRVGCSIGAAIWQPGAEPLADAMARADDALYAAKRAGRGQFRQALPARPSAAEPGAPADEAAAHGVAAHETSEALRA